MPCCCSVTQLARGVRCLGTPPYAMLSLSTHPPSLLLQLLSPTQWARLVVAAWPFYPDPSKWAPLLVAEAAAGGS